MWWKSSAIAGALVLLALPAAMVLQHRPHPAAKIEADPPTFSGTYRTVELRAERRSNDRGELASALDRRLEEIFLESNIDRRRQMLSEMGEAMPLGDIQRILSHLLRSSREREARAVIGLLLARWAKDDPDAVFVWGMRLPDTELQGEAVCQAARAKGARDFTTGLLWAERLKGPEIREQVLHEVSRAAADGEPAAVLARAGDLPEGDHLDAAVRKASAAWAARDPASLAEWAGRQDQTAILGIVSEVLADHDAVAAATLVAEKTNAGTLDEDAVIEVARRWAGHAPEDAAAWVDGFPDGSMKEAAEDAIGSAGAGKAPVR